MKRRAAREPPRMSSESGTFSCAGSKMKPKNWGAFGLPAGCPVKLMRYEGRTMLCPIRHTPVWNSTGMNACPSRGR